MLEGLFGGHKSESAHSDNEVHGVTHEELLAFKSSLDKKAESLDNVRRSVDALESAVTEEGINDFNAVYSNLLALITESEELDSDVMKTKVAGMPMIGEQSVGAFEAALARAKATMVRIEDAHKSIS